MEDLASLPAATIAELRALAISSDDPKHVTLHMRLQEAGVAKLGRRLRVIGALLTAEKALEPTIEQTMKTSAAASPRPRVAFVCHTGYFAGDTFGGATRASLAMMREARRICGTPAEGGGGMDVIATCQTPVPEALVFALDAGRLGELDWEGERVLVGRKDQIASVLQHRRYDVVISLSIEEPILRLALGLSATAVYATPHNYYLPPFGPFNRFEVRPGHPELLAQLDALLSPCEVRRHSRRAAGGGMRCAPIRWGAQAHAAAAGA